MDSLIYDTTTPGTGRWVPQQAGLPQLGTEARQLAGCGQRNERDVRDLLEVPGDRPQVLRAGHPAQAVEASEIDRPAVPAQRALTRKVEVLLEVRHRKLAQRPVDGLAKAQPCEFAGGDRAPEAMPPKDRDHVILVADRRQIHDQGRVALDAQ